jgi:putative SOS response-associated peptidase YedK
MMKMCGRFLLTTDYSFEEIKNFVNEISEKYKEEVNGEVFPTHNIPAVYSHNGKIVLSAAKWGFPNFKNSGVIINARAETLAEKPMFRRSFALRRCLVPANGYYEWLTHEDKTKTRYRINVKEKSLFYMAGLYDIFTDKSGKPYAAITIITTEANSDISFIHNRMPLILQYKDIKIWLNTDNDLSTIQRLMSQYPVGKINYEVV